MAARNRDELDRALEEIDDHILPTLSAMLGTMRDTALLSRSGADAKCQADELRALAAQLDGIRKQMEMINAGGAQPFDAASAA